VLGLFGFVAVLIAWQILLGAIAARRFKREAMILWDQGWCPFCGRDRQGMVGITCTHCGNYIDGMRREAVKRAAKPRR
jgi:hypothetical protein